MLHLRRLSLLDLGCLTALGRPLGDVLDEWEGSQRRRRFRQLLRERDGVDPDGVILDPEAARRAGMTGTVAFPVGNLAPQGAVVKSAAIDPSVVDADGVYRKTGPARVFTSERAAVAAIKGLSGIIVTGNKDIDPETLEKAESEGIVILSTGLQTCETAGIVYNLFLTDKGGGKA